MRRRSQLPRTSRVNEKIIEYYLKFGQERDLEKYMRLYSPCESKSCSTTTMGSCHSEDEGRVLRRLFHQETEATTESDSEEQGFIVPIDFSTKNMTEKYRMPKGDECTSSAPDLHTPPPRSQKDSNTKQTQTPESITKSHRRLEWDSLGDVGYRKSLSTSNISILERSVLKEYFQEMSSISSSKRECKTNEGLNECKQDKQKVTHKAEKNEIIKTASNQEPDKQKEANQLKKPIEKRMLSRTTPPLASSTMMIPKSEMDISTAAPRPKLVSRNTSISLPKGYDQYAQTSMQRIPEQTSREIQVTLSSATSASSSNAAASATPSSFDYYSSRSTHSTTDNEKYKASLGNQHKTIMQTIERPKHMHPFVAGLHEMLASNKMNSSRKGILPENNNETSLQQVHDTLKQVLTENKENSTASSLLLNSPQLDLGIQLLCSLIDARSLNQKQKKKLVRDIVKRISTLNIDDNGANGAERMAEPCDYTVSAQSSASETNADNRPVMDATLKSTSTVTVARTAKDAINISDLDHDIPESSSSDEDEEQLVHVNVINKPSPPTTSAKALAKLKGKSKSTRKTQTSQAPMRTDTHGENGSLLRLADIIDSPARSSSENVGKKPADAELHSGKGSSASKASTTSKDVTTQKMLINKGHGHGDSDTDLDVVASSTMREWLNPMTQSEIDYEEKKLEFTRNAAKRDKIIKCLDSEKMDSERRSQLKWIQSEIQRLETLRCLLSKPNVEHGHERETTPSINNDATAHVAEKLYDTVFSDHQHRESVKSSTTSSALSSGSKPMQEIEVIIEESNEDVIVLDDKIKRSKQRKRETQIVYDKPTEMANTYDNITAGKARFRTMAETVTTNEEQVLPPESARPSTPIPQSPAKQLSANKQRSKIDTPSFDSNDGESVGSFAKQRKREFLEQYRNKKRMHYESLLHQQQQLLIQQQQQIIQELQQRCNAMSQTPAGAAIDHYSVPHNVHNTYCPYASEQRPYHQAYFQQPFHKITATQSRANVGRRPHPQPHRPPCPPCPPRAQTRQNATVNYSRKTQTILSEQSTSSIFCISSEVSIPMGSSSTTSSTTTTTHQYDDVAAVGAISAGVGVQTGASLRRTQPLFGRRLLYDGTQARNMPNWATYDPQPVCSGQSISVQVKPKAIAYVIQFDKKTTSSTTTTATTTATTSASQPTNSISNPSNEISNLMNAEPKQYALQDYLVRAKPKFIAQTKERKAILNQIQALRQERGRELRDIIENASENSLDSRLQRLPPPATKRLRIFATKEMKAMTQRHCENLPEVVMKKERVREERRRNGNRLIRDIFNQRLQRRVRTGKLSLNHSKTVI